MGDLGKAIDEIIAKYKELVGDGKLSLSDVISLMAAAASTLWKLVKAYAVPSKDRKGAVLEAMDKFYDEVVRPIDITLIPNFIEPFVDSWLKQMLLFIVGGWISALGGILDRDEDKVIDPVVPTPDGGGDFKPIPFTPYLPQCLMMKPTGTQAPG